MPAPGPRLLAAGPRAEEGVNASAGAATPVKAASRAGHKRTRARQATTLQERDYGAAAREDEGVQLTYPI